MPVESVGWSPAPPCASRFSQIKVFIKGDNILLISEPPLFVHPRPQKGMRTLPCCFPPQQCVRKSSGLPVLCPCHPDPSPAGLQVQEIIPEVQVTLSKPFHISQALLCLVLHPQLSEILYQISFLYQSCYLLFPAASSWSHRITEWVGLEGPKAPAVPPCAMERTPEPAQVAPSPVPPGLAGSLCWMGTIPAFGDLHAQLLLHGPTDPCVPSPSSLGFALDCKCWWPQARNC